MKNLKLDYATTNNTKKVVATNRFSTVAVLSNTNIVTVKSPKANTIPPFNGEYLFRQAKNC